jgi:hypothetical protein
MSSIFTTNFYDIALKYIGFQPQNIVQALLHLDIPNWDIKFLNLSGQLRKGKLPGAGIEPAQPLSAKEF